MSASMAVVGTDGAGAHFAGGRDLRIDLLRGFCVLIMIVDHVAGKSPLFFLTGGGNFLTSAAEGFIIVSGYTAGMVYGRLVTRDGLLSAMNKAISRAFSLYLLTVALTLLLAPIAEALRLPMSLGLDMSRSLKFVLSVLTLHRTYVYVNILPLYTLLFLALPLALLMLEKGHARLLLGLSWLIWLIYQVYPDTVSFPWEIAGGYLFSFPAWQLLFFNTLLLGYYQDRLPKFSPGRRAWLHALTGLAFAALIGLAVLLRLPAERLPGPLAGLQGSWPAIQTWVLDDLFSKAKIAPGRLVASAVTFGFFFLSLSRWWQPLSRALSGLLLPFGQHALYAWTVHIFALLGIGLLMMATGLGEDKAWLNALLQLTTAAFVWFLTSKQFLAVNGRTRRYWYAAPAALAVLTLVLLQLPPFR